MMELAESSCRVLVLGYTGEINLAQETDLYRRIREKKSLGYTIGPFYNYCNS